MYVLILTIYEYICVIFTIRERLRNIKTFGGVTCVRPPINKTNLMPFQPICNYVENYTNISHEEV